MPLHSALQTFLVRISSIDSHLLWKIDQVFWVCVIWSEFPFPVVLDLESTIHWIKLYTVDNAICFTFTYPPNSNLLIG